MPDEYRKSLCQHQEVQGFFCKDALTRRKKRGHITFLSQEELSIENSPDISSTFEETQLIVRLPLPYRI